jgi:hypothetical protein
LFEFLPAKLTSRFYCRFLPAKIDEQSISIADFFPPNRFLPAKLTSRFLLPISSSHPSSIQPASSRRPPTYLPTAARRRRPLILHLHRWRFHCLRLVSSPFHSKQLEIAIDRRPRDQWYQHGLCSFDVSIIVTIISIINIIARVYRRTKTSQSSMEAATTTTTTTTTTSKYQFLARTVGDESMQSSLFIGSSYYSFRCGIVIVNVHISAWR